jgi:arylsulfatase A-like enzyme
VTSDKHLPTVHGFDEFFGNLYHLNAEEEPETYYYPKDPEFRRSSAPAVSFTAGWMARGAKIKDTGPLTRKRMETVDREFHASAMEFVDAPSRPKNRSLSGTTATRMHVWTRLKKESVGAPASVSILTAW